MSEKKASSSSADAIKRAQAVIVKLSSLVSHVPSKTIERRKLSPAASIKSPRFGSCVRQNLLLKGYLSLMIGTGPMQET